MSTFPIEASQNATPEALARLLEHPALWRGRSAARIPTVASGFAALDAALAGGGWPRSGLVEVVTPQLGIGELALFTPALALLSHEPVARWCTWVAPPFVPFAPGLAAHGIALERVLVVHAKKPLWAFEQALGSGACAAALAWVRQAGMREVRRLQLATERGRTLGVLFREPGRTRESTCSALRLRLAPAESGIRITFVKSRGGMRGSLDLHWQS